ncbi:hypothetical protein Tco_0068972, partial [Tanacetum coccineum]
SSSTILLLILNFVLLEMTLKELEIPMSVGSLAGSTANVPDEELEMVVASPVANNVVGAEESTFTRKGIITYHWFVMSNKLINREARDLSAEVFRLRGEVETLKDKLDV